MTTEKPEPISQSDRPPAKLTGRQRSALLAMASHGGGWPGRWVYDTPSGTRRLMEAFVTKDLVDHDTEADRFTLNEAGLSRVSEIKKEVAGNSPTV